MTLTVLTGDLVDSSTRRAVELDDAFEALRQAADSLKVAMPSDPSAADAAEIAERTETADAAPALRWARRGGDGWQMAGAGLGALRSALVITAALGARGWATRIAIAEGAGIVPRSGDLNAAHGPAFTASGRLLEEMSGRRRMDHASGGPAAAALRMADHIAQGWTRVQSQTMAMMLVPAAGSRAQAARAMGKSRQAVDQALQGAGFGALQAALEAWERQDAAR